MSYFLSGRRHIKLPIGIEPDRASPSLWRGQRGAIFAISQHFLDPQSKPGIISMPTGSGKTVVITVSPFLLDAKRVLVLTPSRLVRGQIAQEFRTMERLKGTGVLSANAQTPTVKEVERQLRQVGDWNELRKYDVTIATPNVSSPFYKNIAEPPEDLFDVLLIDEAHYSAAQTWKHLLEGFPNARKVLFTATPFRNDSKEINGKFIYTYSLSQAFQDEVIGPLSFQPVSVGDHQNSDERIAEETEKALREDRENGFDHIVMVRADTKKRAQELHDLYKDKTNLRLEVVDSDKKVAALKATIAQLENGQLDGIVCVDMMSEGFNFPKLKIAALHAPHKSLGVTLQFIGRFARKGDGNLGEARFLAVQSEIAIEAEQLYKEGKVWSSIVPGLLDTRVENEKALRHELEKFEVREVSDEELLDTSLYAIRPPHHVKVYQTEGEVSLDQEISFPSTYQVKYRNYSDELSCTALVIAHRVRPVWTSEDTFDSVVYSLVVAYHSKAHNMLFICSSMKSEYIYHEVNTKFCPGGSSRLPHTMVRKALAGLTKIEVQNFGMRSRTINKSIPSYQTWTGADPLQALTKNHSYHYTPGHLSGRAIDGSKQVNFGVSSGSKVWSSDSSQIPGLIEWCEGIANRLSRDENVVTNSEFDNFIDPEIVSEYPLGILAANWDDIVYFDPPRIFYGDKSGIQQSASLLTLEVGLEKASSNTNAVKIVIEPDQVVWKGECRINPSASVEFLDAESTSEIAVEFDGVPVPMKEYLSILPLHLYFSDNSRIVGNERFVVPDDKHWQPFNPEQVIVHQWNEKLVDITVEFRNPKKVPRPGHVSIHEFLENHLPAIGYDIVFYDHSTGECADFIAIRREGNSVLYELYHCKGSGAVDPGYREGDVSDVSSQVVKCLPYIGSPEAILVHVQKRELLDTPRFIVGNIEGLKQLTEAARYLQRTYRIVAVQPGARRANMDPEVSRILAAAHDYISAAGCEPLLVWGSA